MIAGVKIIKLEGHVDDRGFLIELLRNDDQHFVKFGQLYLVESFARGTIRAFHKHSYMWEYFYVFRGNSKFVLVDDNNNSDTYEQIMTVVIGEKNQSLLVVPPGVFHGHMSLDNNTLLIAISSEVYRKESPDETRIAYDSFNFDWSIKPR
ncbi:MAG: dTDP-4-dehydrorhamnose 3,5-epimerase [Parcubacteria group bacterium LiPW_30]|nr:MAG: dTDP-4-dehydrorhamnose 3,5-epimerase [Parcubacteria group bacterium LiPW_30]